MVNKGSFRHQKIKVIVSIINGLLVLILSGCSYLMKEPISTAPQSYTAIPFALRQQKLITLNGWQLNGSFSIQQAGQIPIIANYGWQQFNYSNYRIEMNAPLNLVSVVITGQPGGVNLQSSQGISRQAASPELLMQSMLGWSLPISNLIYWVRGLPANTPAANESFDTFGHLIALQQDGWSVQLSHYEAVASGFDLPKQIDLQRPGIIVKILAKTWVLTATPHL